MTALRRSRPAAALLLAFAVCGPFAVRAQTPAGCTTGDVKTEAGPVCGTEDSVTVGRQPITVSKYLGIPYAQPPVGDLRWFPPQPLPSNSWTATRPALAFGSVCPQSAKFSEFSKPTCQFTKIANQSEDCLFLNVWVPNVTTPGPKPVMVFIHGGAYVMGSGSSPVNDGTYLAAAGSVIVVSLNYRLGSLGFLALKGFLDSSYPHHNADNSNFGFRDQILALRWVQQNIANFGGDPGNVTVFGESAGAMSVGLHVLSSTQSSGLFKAAVMESNPLGLPYKSLQEAQSVGDAFTKVMLCWDWKLFDKHPAVTKANCMMRKPACDLVAFETGLINLFYKGLDYELLWAPAMDTSNANALFRGQPFAALAANPDLPIPPMVLGTNTDEGLLFSTLFKLANLEKKVSLKQYKRLLKRMFGDRSSQVSSTYGCTADDCFPQLTQVMTDYVFTCANRYLASQAVQAKAHPSLYVYQFTQQTSDPACNLWQALKLPCAGPDSDVCHGNELLYVFNTPKKFSSECAFTPAEQTVSDAMVGYWASFGAGQSPTTGVSNWPAAWPRFQPPRSTYLILNESPTTPDDPLNDSAHCTALWDTIGYENPEITRSLLSAVKQAKR